MTTARISKAQYVKEFLEPALVNAGIGIVRLEYVENEHMYEDDHHKLRFEEEVIIYYESGHYDVANVFMDSHIAIMKDVLKNVRY